MPKVSEVLYPYQLEAANRIATKKRQGLFDDPGAGKTKTVLGALEIAGLLDGGARRILILATKTGAKLTWWKEALEACADHAAVVVDAFSGSLAKRHATFSRGDDVPLVFVASHGLFSTPKSIDPALPIFDQQWDAIIVDESHRVLPMKSFDPKEMTYFWRGLSRLRHSIGGIRCAMTGTPDRGKLENRYGTWAFLLPEKYNSAYNYHSWLYDNFVVSERTITIKGRYGNFTKDLLVAGSLRRPDLWAEMDDVMTIRRTKVEIAKNLPPKRYIDIERELPPALEKAYERFTVDFADDGTRSKAESFAIRAAQFATCEWSVHNVGGRQEARPIPRSASWKREWIVDWLESRGFDGPTENRVVIVSQFTKLLVWLKDELHFAGINQVEVLSGKQSLNDRLRIQTSFQSKSPEGVSIILLNTSVGDSIDLDAASDMIFVDEVQDPDRTTQTEDRIHRVSRMHHVFIWRLRSIGTLDMGRAATNQNRFTKTRRVYDGRRGVDFARTILARLAQ